MKSILIAIALLVSGLAYGQTAEEYLDRAQDKIELKDYRGAIDDYNKAIELNPNYANAYKERGFAKSMLADYRGAMADCNKAIELNPNDADAYMNRGAAKSMLGDYKGLMADFNKASEAYWNSGLDKVELGDYKGAIADYSEIIELNLGADQVAAAYNERGFAKGKLQDRFIKLIKETAELEFWPVFENTEMVGEKAAFQYLEQLDSVVAKYKDPSAYTAELFTTDSIPALDLNTNEPLKNADGNDSITVTRAIDGDIYTRRYPIASYSGNYGSNGQGIPRSSVLFRVTSEGKDRISEVLDAKDSGGRLFSSSIIPENILLRWDAKPSVSDTGTEFYSLYALNDVSRREKSELNSGTITNAIQTFDQYDGMEVSMQMNSEGAQAWGKMTQAAYDGDPSRPNKAIAITLDGLVYFAPSVNSPILNGSFSISMGDDRDAFADYNKAIELNPNYGYAYLTRGLAKEALKDYRGAIADYNRAIELKPNYAEYYHYRGVAKARLEDYKGAIADFTEAIELKPNYAEAYMQRGMSKLILGQKDEGCVDLSKAGELGYYKAYDAIKQFCN